MLYNKRHQIPLYLKLIPKLMYMNMYFNCCRALNVNLQKVFYNSQASVGDMQYTIILFISIIFLPSNLTILVIERGGAIIIL